MAKKSDTLDFNSLMSKIRSEHGEDSVKLGSELEEEGWNFVPTGVVDLDLALGGGFPKGAIVDIYGPSGSGKCVPANALIWTAKGLLTVGEIFDLAGVDKFSTETEVDSEFPLINGDGEEESTITFTTNGFQEIVTLVTDSGRRLRSTRNHPHWVSSDGDIWDWKLANDVAIGDTVKIQKLEGSALEKTNSSPFSFTKEQAYVIGVLTVRGFVDSQGQPQLLDSITNAHSDFERYFTREGLDGIDLMGASEDGPVDGTFGGKFPNVRGLYETWGAVPTPIEHRTIPRNIRLNSEEVIYSFLSGVIDACGEWSVDAHTLTLKLESLGLAEQLQLLFNSYGLYPKILKVDLIPELDKPEWHVFFDLEDMENYLSFANNFKFPNRVVAEQETRYEKIVSIEEDNTSSPPTFDFSMPSNTFLLNGAVTHNTGLALSFLSNIQKEKPCVYLDLEKAFDPQLARLLGVDLNSLQRVRMKSAEDNLQFIINAAKTNEVGCIIVDSAAGLVSAAELAGEIGDSTVGKIGRLLSQTLRILTKLETDMVLIFINQTYAKIGAMPGTSTTTVGGGSGIKYFSMTRIKVARTGQVARGGTVIGHNVKFTVEKARLSEPMVSVEVPILYGVGYDNEESVIRAAVQLGIFEENSNKSWITDTRTGEKWNGAKKLSTYMRENPTFSEALKEEVLLGAVYDLPEEET